MTLVKYKPRYKNMVFLLVFVFLCYGLIYGNKSISEYSSFKRNLLFRKSYIKDIENKQKGTDGGEE